MPAPFPDAVVAIDSVAYPISRAILSLRSPVLRACFEGASNDKVLSDALQFQWDSVRGIIGDPSLSFQLLLDALESGVASLQLPRRVLDYYATEGVAYGCVFIRCKVLSSAVGAHPSQVREGVEGAHICISDKSVLVSRELFTDVDLWRIANPELRAKSFEREDRWVREWFDRGVSNVHQIASHMLGPVLCSFDFTTRLCR